MGDFALRTLPALPPAKPPVDLFARIMRSIERLQLRRLFIRLSLVAASFVSIAAFVAWQWSSFWTEVASSSFGEYVKLAFSDPDIVLGNAKDLALGLLDTLPVNALLVVFINMLLLLGAIAYIQSIRHVRRNMHTNRPLILG